MQNLRKLFILILPCLILLTGCSNSTEQKQKQKNSLKVYSFSGENESLLHLNGVIIIDNDQEILYGGNLKLKDEEFGNREINSYTIKIYVAGIGDDHTLLVSSTTDVSGGTLNLSADIGSIKGDIFNNIELDDLADNLWLELKSETLDGEEIISQLQLKPTEITKDGTN